MWFRSFSLLFQSSFDSSIVQNISNIKFFYISSKKRNIKNILTFNTFQIKEYFPLKMNLVSGEIAQSEDKVLVQSRGLRFPVNHYPFRGPPSEGYPVILGMRPENVHATLGDRKVSTTLDVNALISNGENRGPDLIVFYEYHDTQLIGRFLKNSEKPSSGEQIRIWMDCAVRSIFCQSTGQRL